MRHQGPQPIGVLRLGILASIATTLTPPLVTLAQTGFGVRDVTLHAGQSGDHENLLRTKKADLAITSNPFYDMDDLSVTPYCRSSFYSSCLLSIADRQTGSSPCRPSCRSSALVTRRVSDDRSPSICDRIRVQPQQVIQADRSSMVTACVSHGMGFTLLTPSLLIDGFVEQMPLRVLPLPVAGFSRTITVVSRENELADFPRHVADISRETLVSQIGKQMGEVGLGALKLLGAET